MRILLHYGGYYLRYGLQISGLSSVHWADASLYFCAQFYRGTSLSATPPTTVPAALRAARLPRGTRHEGLVGKVQICRLVPLEQVPLAGSTPLKGRQADSYKYQSG